MAGFPEFAPHPEERHSRPKDGVLRRPLAPSEGRRASHAFGASRRMWRLSQRLGLMARDASLHDAPHQEELASTPAANALQLLGEKIVLALQLVDGIAHVAGLLAR